MADLTRGAPGAIVVVVPVLNRPHAVAPLLENIAAATPEPHRVAFIPDPDDELELEAIRAAGGDVVLELAGGYAAKVNAAAAVTDEPYVMLAADDLRFHRGWATAALELMSDTVGVVGTNDLGNRRVIRGDHATHSLVARWYVDELGTIDEPGRILHEGYRHNFCDDELVGTAKSRGAFAFARDAVVEHLHPNWGKGDDDETYQLGMSSWREDRRRFHERARLWRRRP